MLKYLQDEDLVSDHECGGSYHPSQRDCLQGEYDLPFAPTVCSNIITSWPQAHIFIKKNVALYPFVKTCIMSPKDWNSPPVFASADDAMLALQNSTRTNRLVRDHLHIIMKQKRDYSCEARCFVVADKLKMVCGNMSHDVVIETFEKYKLVIPFHYCCLELGMVASTGQVECIEINKLGKDCCIAPFDYEQDWEKLFIGEEIHWGDV